MGSGRDGGAGAGGEAEEEAHLGQEGEGGELQEQWDHHQDFAETLRRWKKWQTVCSKTLADCCGSRSRCCLCNPPTPSPAGKCRVSRLKEQAELLESRFVGMETFGSLGSSIAAFALFNIV